MLIARREFLKASGALVVSFSMLGRDALALTLPAPRSVDRDSVDSWLAVGKDGRVTCFVGKVDLGTGTRTALAQMAADELEVPFDRVDMVMGDTARTPDQWLTAASLSIAVGGMELRRAAATARHALLERAAQHLGVPAGELAVENGVVRAKADASNAVPYADLVGPDGLHLQVDQKAALKKPGELRLIGKSIPRVDIPQKVTGEFTFITDVRLAGMLHARVIRPEDEGARLVSFDDSAARAVAGFVQTVRKEGFLAVVAENEWAAVKAARAMKVTWTPGTGLPDPSQLFDIWRNSPIGKVEDAQKVGDAAAVLTNSLRRIKATYDFAIQTHASIGPSCAVADFSNGRLTVWTPSQGPHPVLHEIAEVTGLPKEAIRLIYVDGSGCFGRNGHEDATADAALITTLIGKPVRVQWMRADETSRAPKSPPTVVDLEAGINAQNNVSAWKGDFYIGLNHLAANKPLDFPLLALTETGKHKPGNFIGFMFQNAAQPYAFPNVLVRTHHVRDMIFRASHLRSPGRLENNFANECFADEIAAALKVDPAEFRLKHLSDPRGHDVIRAAMKLAGWQSRPSPSPDAASGTTAKGRGIAYVRYNDRITYVAVVADVEVSRASGEIRVTRMCVGHDCGQMINPDGVANQVEGCVIQTVGRTLMEEVKWDRHKVTSVDWATYPIIRFPDVPRVELALIDRPDEAPWGAGEPAAVPVPAAIGNAVFDAVGVRLRSVPFTPAKVKAALAAAPGQRS
jgi:CO/xanthine dehydrogenase Mo-binding subunit